MEWGTLAGTMSPAFERCNRERKREKCRIECLFLSTTDILKRKKMTGSHFLINNLKQGRVKRPY